MTSVADMDNFTFTLLLLLFCLYLNYNYKEINGSLKIKEGKNIFWN